MTQSGPYSTFMNQKTDVNILDVSIDSDKEKNSAPNEPILIEYK